MKATENQSFSQWPPTESKNATEFSYKNLALGELDGCNKPSRKTHKKLSHKLKSIIVGILTLSPLNEMLNRMI